jgi:hypothetical protein
VRPGWSSSKRDDGRRSESVNLLERVDAASPDAPVIVLFGGNPHRRDEVLSLIRDLGGATAIGALSEDEGMALLASLTRVDLVLIGGRYSDEQRRRIRAYVKERLPGCGITEPGWDYPYDDLEIVADIRRKLAS